MPLKRLSRRGQTRDGVGGGLPTFAASAVGAKSGHLHTRNLIGGLDRKLSDHPGKPTRVRHPRLPVVGCGSVAGLQMAEDPTIRSSCRRSSSDGANGPERISDQKVVASDTCITPSLHSGGHPHMRRRAFVAVLVATAAWPRPGYVQQAERLRRVGVLISPSQGSQLAQASVTAFVEALRRFGWVEGQNIRMDYRFAAGDPTLFKSYAAELVGLSPDAILTGGSPAVAALQQQTRTIPIVFTGVGDPIGQGFVQGLARPGGNITGFGANDPTLMGKWLQLLQEIAPRVTRVAVIFNPDTALFSPLFNRAIEAAGPSLGIMVTLAPVHDDPGIEEAIAAQAREPGGGVVSLPDPFNVAHRDVIIAAASRHSLPLIGTLQYPRAGGLIAYWYDGIELYAQAASYIDRILKGASPADLPVQQPAKYSLIINLKTAKALGLTVPPSMLGLADELID